MIAEWVSSEGLRRMPETTQEVNLVYRGSSFPGQEHRRMRVE